MAVVVNDEDAIISAPECKSVKPRNDFMKETTISLIGGDRMHIGCIEAVSNPAEFFSQNHSPH